MNYAKQAIQLKNLWVESVVASKQKQNSVEKYITREMVFTMDGFLLKLLLSIEPQLQGFCIQFDNIAPDA